MAAAFKTHLKALILRKAADEGQGITQKEVQTQTGLSQPTIARWYAGTVDRIEADTIERLTRYLGCQMSDLVTLQVTEE